MIESGNEPSTKPPKKVGEISEKARQRKIQKDFTEVRQKLQNMLGQNRRYRNSHFTPSIVLMDPI
jgi:hypothetical protein